LKITARRTGKVEGNNAYSEFFCICKLKASAGGPWKAVNRALTSKEGAQQSYEYGSFIRVMQNFTMTLPDELQVLRSL